MIGPIDPLVLTTILLVSRAFGVPGPLIAAIIQAESGWNIHALGDRDLDQRPHSFGLMQLHDEGAGVGYTQDQLLDPYFNIFAGTEYLKACLDAYPNNIKLAISAYNQGIGGAAEKGYGANKDYVNKVLEFRREFEEEWKRLGR